MHIPELWCWVVTTGHGNCVLVEGAQEALDDHEAGAIFEAGDAALLLVQTFISEMCPQVDSLSILADINNAQQSLESSIMKFMQDLKEEEADAQVLYSHLYAISRISTVH